MSDTTDPTEYPTLAWLKAALAMCPQEGPERDAFLAILPVLASQEPWSERVLVGKTAQVHIDQLERELEKAMAQINGQNVRMQIVMERIARAKRAVYEQRSIADVSAALNDSE